MPYYKLSAQPGELCRLINGINTDLVTIKTRLREFYSLIIDSNQFTPDGKTFNVIDLLANKNQILTKRK
jgi:hypothetical protein